MQNRPAKAETKAAPFANMNYNEQLELKRTTMINTLEILAGKIGDANYLVSEYVDKQKELNSGLICPFQGVIPSPVCDQYRNNFNFTIGKSLNQL